MSWVYAICTSLSLARRIIQGQLDSTGIRISFSEQYKNVSDDDDDELCHKLRALSGYLRRIGS